MDINYQLVVRKGPKPGQTFPLFAVTTTVGRDPISDIAINDPEVSRQHARISKTKEGLLLEDLESTNGTFLNGIRLGSNPVKLELGDEIMMGSGLVLILQPVLDTEEDPQPALPTIPEAAQPPANPDPMLPPDFGDPPPLAELSNLGVQENNPPPPDDLDEAFFEEQAEAPPPPNPPLIIPGDQPNIQDARDKNPARRIAAIAALLVVILSCCCCGFLFFMYQWGGDWLLQQMGLLP
jgi:predicted component of type VI protein secretion system